ncbi:fluoride efflux transporter CrcB [Aquibacillus rhizosphaerae]|uniref:Fluoride-specific ion channel FluC n=1 Tax=Aquibacillus rhizosphaerae TaxID=3051431 RepID=A0ABT7L418_9BACI|nr:fluoride efflux transporter CrcB [Aquibacillus sp. LR5S19]MDL4839915.1 fluoride efflux transporter CrcB [Aquibacillus sp. LR5S19]
MNLLFVAAGGFLGAISRYSIGLKANKTPRKPVGTLSVNISGSALLGLLLYFYEKGELPEIYWLFLGVGFCGAYTTFSTFGTETLSMIQANMLRRAIIYVLSSLIISIGSVMTIFFVLKAFF